MRTAVAALAVAVAATAAFAAPPPAGAVVGGEEADPGEWPWQVALLDGEGFFCGGSLVALDVVVTAAHCVDGYAPGDLDVLAGTVDRRGGGQTRQVARIDMHEGYDPFTTENDIALVHLVAPFTADRETAPIGLPEPGLAEDLVDDGDPAVVTGFGSTTENGGPSRLLLEAAIEAIDDDTCAGFYGSELFPDTNVCAGFEEGHVDACFGDSGGPLVAPGTGEPDADPDEWFLVGIVSWGDGCARAESPTVYTEVAAYLDWLADHGALGVDGERFDGGALRLPVVGTRGKASRYPSRVEVPSFDGPVTEVAVELRGLTHERPEDLDIWLVAPDGTTVTLLSDVGGSQPVHDVDVVVTEGAPGAGAGGLALQLGPTDVRADTQRKGPRPPASLAELAGIDPVGKWELLIADDSRGGRGRLAGWTLILR